MSDHSSPYAPVIEFDFINRRVTVRGVHPPSDPERSTVWGRFWATVVFDRRRNPNPFPRFRLIGRARG